MKSRVRILYLWLLFVLLAGLLAELGCAAGAIPLSVLDDFARNAAPWWRQPAWVHVITALLITLAAIWTAALVLSPGVSGRTAAAAAVAAALLASHFSPLFALLPFYPLAGALLAWAGAARLLHRSGCNPDPRAPLGGLVPAGRSDRILWSLIVLLVIYAFVNQFKEAALVVVRQTDFGTFYDAAAAAAEGADPYGATAAAYFYPPTFAFYFRPLTWLPKAGSSLLWFTFKLALAVSALAAVYALIRDHRMSAAGRRWLIIGIVLVAARFILADLQYGNVNVVVLWLTLMAVVLDFRERSVWAGLALAAAISIKIVPAVFLIYAVVRGRTRFILWTALWLLALNLLPFAFSPHSATEAWTAYLVAGVRDKIGSRLAQPDNQSLWGVLNRTLDLSLMQIRLMWAACAAAFAIAAARAAFVYRHREFPLQAGTASLFFLLGLIASPGSWVVHYGAVLLPMSYLLGEIILRRGRAVPCWITFVLANLAFTASGWSRPTVRLSIEHSWFFAANCLLFFTLVGLLSISRRGRATVAGAGRRGTGDDWR